ncbi:MAG TPA: polyprenyl synthetase family protein [Solirubrobacterales bacterium]
MTNAAVPAPVTKVLDAAGTWLPASMAEVEKRLERGAASPGGPLAEDATATLAAGGKRLRPLLVLLCAGPESAASAVSAATAVELVHMATLVHDDVLDAAPLRRGRPTVLATSGRPRATATGDLLFSRAFAELAGDGDPVRVALLTTASVALARGELAQRRDAFDLGVTAERYLERCRLKTAALFECACSIGDGRSTLAGFGRRVGLAFQLLDDVLDVTGPPERTGKARGTDLLDGTITLPLIRARELDTSLAEIDLHGLGAGGAEEVCDRIVATGAADEVRAIARRHVEAAKADLDATGLEPERRRLLDLVADGVVERYA